MHWRIGWTKQTKNVEYFTYFHVQSFPEDDDEMLGWLRGQWHFVPSLCGFAAEIRLWIYSVHVRTDHWVSLLVFPRQKMATLFFFIVFGGYLGTLTSDVFDVKSRRKLKELIYCRSAGAQTSPSLAISEEPSKRRLEIAFNL